MLKVGQRYQWDDGQGVIEVTGNISAEGNVADFVVVQGWLDVRIGHTNRWYINQYYGGHKLFYLEGQDAPSN